MVIVSLVTYYKWECFNAPVFCRKCWFREYGGLFSSEGTGIIRKQAQESIAPIPQGRLVHNGGWRSP